jgi:flagellar biosynthesis/type III secretory pathway M-ring protein FliF/YscJ
MESLHQNNFNWSFSFWSACIVLIFVFIATFGVVGEQRRKHEKNLVLVASTNVCEKSVA